MSKYTCILLCLNAVVWAETSPHDVLKTEVEAQSSMHEGALYVATVLDLGGARHQDAIVNTWGWARQLAETTSSDVLLLEKIDSLIYSVTAFVKSDDHLSVNIRGVKLIEVSTESYLRVTTIVSRLDGLGVVAGIRNEGNVPIVIGTIIGAEGQVKHQFSVINPDEDINFGKVASSISFYDTLQDSEKTRYMSLIVKSLLAYSEYLKLIACVGDKEVNPTSQQVNPASQP